MEHGAAHGRGSGRRDRRDRRTALAQQLPVGLDGRGQYTVPALEARSPRRRRRRSAHRLVARRHSTPAARSAITTCTRSTSRRRSSKPSGVEPPAAVDGVSFAPTFTDAGAPDAHTVQYYEMLGCRALYKDGWKAVVYHPIQSAAPGLDAVPWELYHVAVDRSETHDLAAREPDRLARDGRAVVGGSRTQSGAPARQPSVGRLRVRQAAASSRTRHVRLLAGDGHGVGGSRGERAQSRPHDHRGDRRRRARACCCRRDRCSAGGRCSCTTAACRTCTIWPATANTASTHRSRSAPAPTPSSFASPRRANTAAPAPSPSTRRCSRRAKSGARRRCGSRITGVGLWCGRGGNLPVCDDYTGPFPWTGTLARVVVRVIGTPHVDAGAEAEIAMRRQ